MAKDDYFVIVYQILSYLYQRLKNGEPVDPAFLQHDGPLSKEIKRLTIEILEAYEKGE